jgi:serine phosphatase RsbU (regulator of sigma subunit)
LASQGELLGLVTLGPRSDGLAYSRDDREALATLAAQLAPALRVAQLALARQAQAQAQARIDQELGAARRIQESLLPKSLPTLDGWSVATCYRPAREVGGDFYDFLPLTDGRLGLILGDVSDKGMPAALVMATTMSMLRAVVRQQLLTPGQVLAQVNDLLAADLPPGMFVTCFYAILDPATGELEYANAGQDLPYIRHADGVVSELDARGMPLGLLPAMEYDGHTTTLAPGDTLLFYSDGLVEAHNPQREMFGFPRLMALLTGLDGSATKAADADGPAADVTIPALLDDLATFTGADWEQEDDLTLVTLRRESDAALTE